MATFVNVNRGKGISNDKFGTVNRRRKENLMANFGNENRKKEFVMVTVGYKNRKKNEILVAAFGNEKRKKGISNDGFWGKNKQLK